MATRFLTIRGWLAGALILLLVGGPVELARPCTTGVVSGRATPDGRPLLWKNRDTSGTDNRVIYSTRGEYEYVGVINAGLEGAVWMGVNSAGFAIENSASRDQPGESETGPGNGALMRIALENCATVEDFEALLQRTNGQRRTRANFGVIDARGGAAIFETGHDTYAKYDANDPEVAPHGYVVRSNFSMTGSGYATIEAGEDLNTLYSGRRYLRAEALFAEAAAAGKLDHRFILRHVARDLANPAGRPYSGSVNSGSGTLPPHINTEATLSRNSTVSAAVFHGVRPDEDPRLTTMWVLLGEPTFSVAVPCWVGAEDVAEELRGQEEGPLVSSVIQLRSLYYDRERGRGRVLQTDALPSIWSTVWPVEDRILELTEQNLTRWRGQNTQPQQIGQFHSQAVRMALEAVQEASRKVQPVAEAAAP